MLIGWLTDSEDFIESHKEKRNDNEIGITPMKVPLLGSVFKIEEDTHGFYSRGNLLFHKSWFKKILEVDNGNHYIVKTLFNVHVFDLRNRMDILNDIEILPAIMDRIFYGYTSLFNTMEHGSVLHTKNTMKSINCRRCGISHEWYELAYYEGDTRLAGHHLQNNEKYYIVEENAYAICEDCITTAESCGHCGNRCIREAPKELEINGAKIKLCPTCASRTYTCGDCNHIFMLGRYSTVPTCKNKLLCTKCFEKYDICVKCGKDIKEGVTPIRVFNKKYCKICGHTAKLESYKIQRWNYKPEKTFIGSKNVKDKLYFGIEFEVENATVHMDALASTILEECNKDSNGNFMQFFYAMHDGSLSGGGEYGVEIATSPMTYAAIKENKEVFMKLFSYKDYECKSFESATCGLHIHMSKSCFDKIQIYKILKFIYSNREFILKVSERKTENENYFNLNPDFHCKSLQAIAKDKSHSIESRHAVINLSNTETVEFRLFQGTLEWPRFMKNVQFCKALFDFTQECSLNECTDTKNFINYIGKHKNKYRYLSSFINNDFSIGE